MPGRVKGEDDNARDNRGASRRWPRRLLAAFMICLLVGALLAAQARSQAAASNVVSSAARHVPVVAFAVPFHSPSGHGS